MGCDTIVFTCSHGEHLSRSLPLSQARVASLTAEDEAPSHVSLNPGAAPAEAATDEGDHSSPPRAGPGVIELEHPKMAADHIMHINPEFSEEVRRPCRAIALCREALGL